MTDKVFKSAAETAAYWEGRDAEERRLTAKGAARKAMDLHDLAATVHQSLRRDNARRERILARSPHLASVMDAVELAQASSHELAVRELKELGIDGAGNDPVALLDAHHAGREWVRNGGIRILGGTGARLLGGAAPSTAQFSAQDSAGDSFMTRYLAGKDAADPVGESFLDKYLKE